MKRYYKNLVILLMIVLLTVCFAACTGDNEDGGGGGGGTGGGTALAQPTGISAQIEGANWTLSWDEVENAVSYTVTFEKYEYIQNGLTKTATTNKALKASTNSMEIGEQIATGALYYVSVVANGDGVQHKDSKKADASFRASPLDTQLRVPYLKYTLLPDGNSYEVGKNDLLGEYIAVPGEYEGKPVTRLADSAFERKSVNEKLRYIALPTSLQEVGARAFYGCEYLTEINLPEGVVSVGDNAFVNNYSITKFLFPSTLTTVGSGVFDGCTNIVTMSYLAESDELPAGLFQGAASLEKVEFGTQIKKINDRVFKGCAKISDFSFLSTVTYVGDSAFEGCEQLTDVSFLSNLTHIGDRAFADCTSIVSVHIESTVEYLGSEAFEGCSRLVNISLDQDFVLSSARVFDNTGWYTRARESGTSAVMLGTMLYTYVFSRSDAVSGGWWGEEWIFHATVPLGVEIIAGGAFSVRPRSGDDGQGGHGGHGGYQSSFSMLRQVTIPYTVRIIGEEAFKGSGLETVIFTDDGVNANCLESIGDRAFADCDNLSLVILPVSLKSIGADIVSGTPDTVKICVLGTLAEWNPTSVDQSNTEKLQQNIYFFSADQPTEEGKFWYFDADSVPTIWTE